MGIDIYSTNRKIHSLLGFSFHIPIRNHYYKWRRISFKKNWFCKSCQKIFDLKNWKLFKNKQLSELCCPYCSSESIVWDTGVFKAITDNPSIENINNAIAESAKFIK